MSNATTEQPTDGSSRSDDALAAQLSLVNAKIPVSIDPTKAANVAADGSIVRRSPHRS
jgi:hypothetical protein